MQMFRSRFLFVSALTLLWLSPASAQGLSDIEQLGKSIFFDQGLSINNNQSCASCHDPAAGWTGPIEAINQAGAVYEGSISGSFGNRKPPSAAYATQSPIFAYHRQGGGLFLGGNFWNGRATGERLGNPAADQAQGPFLNPAEQALPDNACVVYFVCTAYSASFESVWGVDACYINWPADMLVQCETNADNLLLSDDDWNSGTPTPRTISLSPQRRSLEQASDHLSYIEQCGLVKVARLSVWHGP